MEIIYDNFYFQVILFGVLFVALIIPAVSLFIRPAKRTVRASLVDAKTGHIFDISTAETSIGRSKTCDITIDLMSVSRFHAVLSYRQKEWLIFDTHSTSGVTVNGQQIDKKQKLADGDLITMGEQQFLFYSTAVTTRQERVQRPDPTRRPVQRDASAARSQQPRQMPAAKPQSDPYLNRNGRR